MTLLVLTLLGCIGACLIVQAAYRLRETTLWPAALWGLAAWAVLLGVEAAHAVSPASLSVAASSHLRYAALVFSLAPGAAVLGAKRPQHNAWQLIVASLLCVLLLPSLRSWAFARGGEMEVHPLLALLIAGLLLSSLFNYLLSPRYRISVGLWSAAQLRLAWRASFGQTAGESSDVCWGAILFASAALGIAAWQARRARRAPLGWPRVWADFCALYGGFWPLRVLERINQQAVAEDWPGRLALGWQAKIAQESGAAGAPPTVNLQRALAALLRRFVSRRWIDERLQPPLPAAGESVAAACAAPGERIDSTDYDPA